MNERELKHRKKEIRTAFIVGSFLLAVTFVAWHFGFFDATNPFDGM